MQPIGELFDLDDDWMHEEECALGGRNGSGCSGCPRTEADE